MRLTEKQRRAVLSTYPGEFKHTQACREATGNRKGSGGHPPSVTRAEDGTVKVDLGGYRCVCDWEQRVFAKFLEMAAGLFDTDETSA